MFLLTDSVDPSLYTKVGNSVITIILLNVILNLMITAWDILPYFVASLKNYRAKYREFKKR